MPKFPQEHWTDRLGCRALHKLALLWGDRLYRRSYPDQSLFTVNGINGRDTTERRFYRALEAIGPENSLLLSCLGFTGTGRLCIEIDRLSFCVLYPLSAVRPLRRSALKPESSDRPHGKHQSRLRPIAA